MSLCGHLICSRPILGIFTSLTPILGFTGWAPFTFSSRVHRLPGHVFLDIYIYIYICIYIYIYIYIFALPLVNSWSTSVLTPYLFFLYLYIYIYIYNPCLEGLCKYKRSESQSLLTKANLSDPCVLPWYTFYIIRYITH